ncbi:DUF2268 domain-containing putative Zn-dependent protease [Aestuariivirga sp.]|uniref:DUF2268 domain-containing putative Zn-dependent protease n=1 Tax=Aestuariivirga sp. TaxID=2650926 RepID=UPI0039E5706F
MRLQLHFLEAEGSLAGLRDQLSDEVIGLVEQIDSFVPPRFHKHTIDVVIQSVPEDGGASVTGACFRRGFITVSVDPVSFRLAGDLDAGLFRRVLARQLHHAMRWAVWGPAMTLGQTLVYEGLADIFSELVAATESPPWSSALAPADWPAVIAQAEQDLENDRYDHALWFVGAGALPRWAGFALGYRLACHFAESHPKAVASGLVDVAPPAVLAVWDEMRSVVLRVRPQV